MAENPAGGIIVGMTTRGRRASTVLKALLAAAGFVLLTVLLPRLGALDALWPISPPQERDWLGQIAATISFVTSPATLGLVVAGLVLWAQRRKLTTLAAAILTSYLLTFGGAMLAGELFRRARPDSPWEYLITQRGYAFPSVQVAVATSVGLSIIAVALTTRRHRSDIRRWWAATALSVLLAALAVLLLGALRVTDVLGGILFGVLGATVGNLLCGLNVPGFRRSSGPGHGRVAVIYNPTRIVDLTVFRDLVERRCTEAGWRVPVWYSTTVDDPGRAMARSAADDGADLVLVAGGDGTVRVVCGELGDSGIPVGLIPSGTGNLLARNLNIPLDTDKALTAALTGRTTEIDLLRLDVPGQRTEHAAVMCGVGLDAAMIDDTSDDLKRQIGFAAYVVAALNHLRPKPIRARVTVDGGQPLEREATLLMVANVGDLQAGLRLVPDALPDDGDLDVVIASPKNQTELTQLVAAIVAQGSDPSTLDRAQGRTVRIELESDELYELDGDVIGRASRLDFRVLPGALMVRVPE